MTTYQNHIKLALIALTAVILAACSSGDSDEDPVTNTAPTFSASSVSISVEENVIGVIYTAQATDAEGNTINYALSGGVDQAKFSIDASSGELRFVSAPDYEVPDDDGRDRTYEVQISASDSLASSSMSLSVSITNVVEDGESNNRAPTASISVSPDPDSTTLTTATEITLNGSDSSDPDGDTLDYTWSQASNQSIDLSSTSAASTSFTAANPGTYTFTLTVDDGSLTDSAEITLEIIQADSTNRAPTASISVSPDPDNTTLTTATEITLNGSASSDPDGDKLTYEWSQSSSQSIDLSPTSTASTTFTAAAPGTYTFTLTVDDGELDHSSEVTLDISQANRAPTASISVSPDPDNTTLTTATEVTLDGSASSDPDGNEIDYTWSQPSTQSVDLSATNTATTTFTATEAGTYTFTLSVSDGELEDSSEAIVTIYSITLPSDFAATAGDTQVTLTWTPYSDDTIYNIYRSSDPNCDLININTCSTTSGQSELFSNVSLPFTDTGLTNATTYYYWVEAIHDGQVQLAESYVSATPQETTTSEPILGTLNDTGIDWGGNYESGNNTDCTSSNISAPQDCHQGRDADSSTNDDSDGHAGFSFTRLNADGSEYAGTGVYADEPWHCVQDNVTGLIWEVKTDDDDLHDKDDKYNWYNTDPATNGGEDGYADDGAICHGYDSSDSATYCNTQAFAARVNAVGLCGAYDWRLPSKEELRSIVDYSRYNPSIDTDYFPNTVLSWFWSSSPTAYNSYDAWIVFFGYGYGLSNSRYYSWYVRLVRSRP